MNCRYCGKEIPNDAAFCPFCGKRTESHLRQEDRDKEKEKQKKKVKKRDKYEYEESKGKRRVTA